MIGMWYVAGRRSGCSELFIRAPVLFVTFADVCGGDLTNNFVQATTSFRLIDIPS